jgi:hypothetical protein
VLEEGQVQQESHTFRWLQRLSAHLTSLEDKHLKITVMDTRLEQRTTRLSIVFALLDALADLPAIE